MHILVALGSTFLRLKVIHLEQLREEYLEHITPNRISWAMMHAVAKINVVSGGSAPFVLSRSFVAEAFESTHFMEPETVPLVWMVQSGISQVGWLNGHFENCSLGEDYTVRESDSLVDSFHQIGYTTSVKIACTRSR